MSIYKIKSAENSKDKPFVLSKGENITLISSIDCKNKFVWFRDNMSQCDGLTSFTNAKLINTNCSSLFNGCSALTDVSISYESAFTKSDSMFKYCVALQSASPSNVGDFSSVVEGYATFSHCHTLTSFTNNLSSLVDGRQFVNECYELQEFNATLPKVENGWGFFRKCGKLATFPTDYPELTNAEEMFLDCKNLTIANFNMPKLAHTKFMFRYCDNLTAYTGDLSCVQCNDDGSNTCKNMFLNCDALNTVDITTKSGNEALFTKSALGLIASATLKVNGTIVS